MTTLEIQSNRLDDDTVVVALTGSADISGAAVLDRHLLSISARHPKHVVFDLSGLTFISSLAMGSLMHFRRGCLAWGGRISIAAANDIVEGALRHARLDLIVPIKPTVSSALAERQPESNPTSMKSGT